MTVVLLHAGVCDHRMWDGVVPALHGAGLKVATPDLRGFGSRPAGLAPFTHAGDVLSLLDALGAEAADLVGASFGARVALQVAALAPERVRSLAVLAPALPVWDYDDPGLREYAAAEEEALERGDVDAAVELNVRFWAGSLSPVGQEYVAEAQRQAFEHDAEEAEEEDGRIDLGAISADTLVMVGDRDGPDFVAIARHLDEAIPRSRLHVVEGAGHLLALERPDVTSEVLAGWLRDR